MIQGGAGDDTYAIDKPGGMTFISNFSVTKGDVLDLTGMFKGLSVAGGLSGISFFSAMFPSPMQSSTLVSGALLTIPAQSGSAATSIFLANAVVNEITAPAVRNSIKVN